MKHYALKLAFTIGMASVIALSGCEALQKLIKEQNALKDELSIDIPNQMVLIAGGTFQMGSPSTETDRQTNETTHNVTVKSFYMCKYEVTLKDFNTFVTDSGYLTDSEKGAYKGLSIDYGSFVFRNNFWQFIESANWQTGVDGFIQADFTQPVIHVSWNDAIAFCSWLSQKTKSNYRLPTEAEWEYACRAGTLTAFNTGQTLSGSKANFSSAGLVNTIPVGCFPPNAWGLYDMHGNAAEWCKDWYDNYPTSAQTDPAGPDTGTERVIRGGCWFDQPGICRSGYRLKAPPTYRRAKVGFRVVRD